MYETNNLMLQQDLEDVVAQTDWTNYVGSCFFVTGATGLIGSRFILALLCANRTLNLGMTVLAVVRNEEKAKGIFREVLNRPELKFVVQDLNEKILCPQRVDYILHCAGVTASRMMVEKPVETIQTALLGTLNVLTFAKENAVHSMIYVSSMEMYGNFKESKLVTEDIMGYIDPLVVRSNYPESKRMCENLCVAFVSEYGVPVKIARLAQVFGAGILPGENRVFAQFARSAVDKTDIVLHTNGQSEGNYCYLSDVISALLILFQKGEDGQAYNISNEATHMTIGEMAQMVADVIAGGEIKVVFDIPDTNVFGYASDTKMKLSSKKMRNLDWQPTYGLEESYRRMIAGMTPQTEK